MKLKNFISSNLRQAAIASVLVVVLPLTSASAVELIGTPTAVGAPTTPSSYSSKLQPLANDQTPGDVNGAGQIDMEKATDEPLTADEGFIEEAVANKLSEESLELVKAPNRHIEAMSHPQSTMGSNMNSAEILIPITAISFSIGGAILLIIVLARLHYRDKERRAQNINANIDRLLAAGRDIPIELLRGDEPYADNEPSLLRDNINLHKGLRNVCLGVGLLAFLSILVDIEIGAIGFILIGLGVSQLLVWKLSGVKTVTKGQD